MFVIFDDFFEFSNSFIKIIAKTFEPDEVENLIEFIPF